MVNVGGCNACALIALKAPIMRMVFFTRFSTCTECVWTAHICVWVCLCGHHRYWKILKRDPRTPIPPCVMAWSAMEVQLRACRSLQTTHGETNTNKPPCVMASSAKELQLRVFARGLCWPHMETNASKMHPWSLRAILCFWRVYLHTQIAVLHVHLINHSYFDHGKKA